MSAYTLTEGGTRLTVDLPHLDAARALARALHTSRGQDPDEATVAQAASELYPALVHLWADGWMLDRIPGGAS